MLGGEWDGVSAAQARIGLQQARDGLASGALGPRSVGFGRIASVGHGDGIDYLVAVTDGTREAAVIVHITDLRLGPLQARGEDEVEQLIDWLNGLAAGVRMDSDHYEAIVRGDPLVF